MAAKHSHECRDCGADIVCLAGETRGVCDCWNGSNDGCPECGVHDRDACRDIAGFRCGECYPARARFVARRY